MQQQWGFCGPLYPAPPCPVRAHRSLGQLAPFPRRSRAVPGPLLGANRCRSFAAWATESITRGDATAAASADPRCCCAGLASITGACSSRTTRPAPWISLRGTYPQSGVPTEPRAVPTEPRAACNHTYIHLVSKARSSWRRVHSCASGGPMARYRQRSRLTAHGRGAALHVNHHACYRCRGCSPWL